MSKKPIKIPFSPREEAIWNAAFATAVCQFQHNASPESIYQRCVAWADNAVRAFQIAKIESDGRAGITITYL